MTKKQHSSNKGSALKHEALLVKHRPEGYSEEEFRLALRAALPVLETINTLLDKEILIREEIPELDYDSPSWSHKQAHRNGFVACVRKLKSLIS